MMDKVILVARVALMIIAAWNITWSIHGARRLTHGNYSPPSFYLAFAFFANATFLAYMIRHFVGGTPDLLILLLLILSIVAAVVCAIGHHVGADLKAKQFYSLYGALPQALAIATLARYDRDAADRVAEDCYRQVADKLGAVLDHAG